MDSNDLFSRSSDIALPIHSAETVARKASDSRYAWSLRNNV